MEFCFCASRYSNKQLQADFAHAAGVNVAMTDPEFCDEIFPQVTDFGVTSNSSEETSEA